MQPFDQYHFFRGLNSFAQHEGRGRRRRCVIMFLKCQFLHFTHSLTTLAGETASGMKRLILHLPSLFFRLNALCGLRALPPNSGTVPVQRAALIRYLLWINSFIRYELCSAIPFALKFPNRRQLLRKYDSSFCISCNLLNKNAIVQKMKFFY